MLARSLALAPSPIRNTDNTIRPTFPSLYSLTLSQHVLQLGAYFSCYPCGLQDLEFFLSVLSVNEGLSHSEQGVICSACCARTARSFSFSRRLSRLFLFLTLPFTPTSGPPSAARRPPIPLCVPHTAGECDCVFLRRPSCSLPRQSLDGRAEGRKDGGDVVPRSISFLVITN